MNGKIATVAVNNERVRLLMTMVSRILNEWVERDLSYVVLATWE